MISISGISQTTIYQADLPQPGDSFVLYIDKTPSVSLGNASASSQIWDYHLLSNDSTKYAPYGITANLPFASSFPTSNSYTYGPAFLYGGPGAPSPGAGIGYTMWGINSTGMWVIGYRSDYDGHGEKNILINPNELLMPVPCTYGYNQQHDSKWEVLFNYVSLPTNPDTLYRSRTHKTLNCDAWGSMTTPLGTFSDVIRVHEYSVTIDSVFGLVSGTVYTSIKWKSDTINKYYFWAPAQRHPVAIAYCNTAGQLQRIEWVSWAQLNTPIVTLDDKTVNIYPNPTTDVARIKLPEIFKTTNYTLSVFDINGKNLITQNGFGTDVSVNSNEFDKGCYFVELQTENGARFKFKLIVN